MIALRINRAVVLSVLLCCVFLLAPSLVLAQSEARVAPGEEGVRDIDLDVQLYLLVASNAPDTTKLAPQLDAIAKELRPILPFTNYRLGATYLSRVKNGRALNVKGIGRTLLVTPALDASVNPPFYEISSSMVSLKTNSSGREVVQLSPFRFGLRIPLQTGTVRSNSGGTETTGSVVYESVGITTDVTMLEGSAVVVGTLDAGRPNETLVLVLAVKRVAMR